MYLPEMGEDRTPTGRRRVTVAAAAKLLGVSVEAIRGRIKRGTLEAEREGDHVFVLLSPDRSRPAADQSTDQALGSQDAVIQAKDETIATLREQLQHERQAHSEARRLLAAALERIPPQLEASEAPEPRESPVSEASPGPSETPTEGPGGPSASVWESLRGETERAEPQSTTQGAQEGAQRPWWRRLVGG